MTEGYPKFKFVRKSLNNNQGYFNLCPKVQKLWTFEIPKGKVKIQ